MGVFNREGTVWRHATWDIHIDNKAQALGPTSIEMNFNDYAGEFMGQLDQDLHIQSKIWLRNLQKGMRVAELDSELAGLYIKPMDAEARLAVEQLAP